MAGIQSRKREHVETVISSSVEHTCKGNGFDAIDFEHDALPEVNLSEINTQTTFLGFKLEAPFIVTGMTGGYPDAEQINKDLAVACEKEGIAFGLGSMRAMVEKPELTRTYDVRKAAPNVFLLGNFGGIQLKTIPIEKIRTACDTLKVNALAVHLNPAQEAVQAGGDTEWKGVLKAITEACKKLGYPIVAKEVGAGLSAEACKKLEAAGVKAIDVSGAGGTSWVAVEILRGGKPEGKVFWDWGIPTATALHNAAAAVDVPLIASGGIRNGLEAAKAIRLGATLAGAASPFIKAQRAGGVEAVRKELQAWKSQLKIAMLCTGSKDLAALRKAKLL